MAGGSAVPRPAGPVASLADDGRAGSRTRGIEPSNVQLHDMVA